jgi:hypothetical protein
MLVSTALSLVLGQSAQKKHTGRSVGGASRQDLMAENGKQSQHRLRNGLWLPDGKMTASVAVPGNRTHSESLLRTPLSYNYAERYMAQLTVRRDGSSNFGANNRYGTFPSFSLGWNLTNEKLHVEKRPDWLTNTKLRFSWGKNGNENIGHFGYIALTAAGNNYVFGAGAAQDSRQRRHQRMSSPTADLKWEESVQTDGRSSTSGCWAERTHLQLSTTTSNAPTVCSSPCPSRSYNGAKAPIRQRR